MPRATTGPDEHHQVLRVQRGQQEAEPERLDEREVLDRCHPLRHRRHLAGLRTLAPLRHPEQQQQHAQHRAGSRTGWRGFPVVVARSAAPEINQKTTVAIDDAEQPADQEADAGAAGAFGEQHQDHRDDRHRRDRHANRERQQRTDQGTHSATACSTGHVRSGCGRRRALHITFRGMTVRAGDRRRWDAVPSRRDLRATRSAARTRLQLPRGLIILLGLAAGSSSSFGMRAVAGDHRPAVHGVVLTITVYPIRTWMRGKGAPSWLATLVLVLGVYARACRPGRRADLGRSPIRDDPAAVHRADAVHHRRPQVVGCRLRHRRRPDPGDALRHRLRPDLSLVGCVLGGALEPALPVGVHHHAGAFHGHRRRGVPGADGAGAVGPRAGDQRIELLRARHPQLLRGGHRLRRHRRRARRHRAGRVRHPRRGAVGADRVRHQLHPEHRVHHRADPGVVPGAAHRRCRHDDRDHRGLLRAQLHHPVGDPAEVRRRLGRADHDGLASSR